jgi:two-component system, cell cycle sensor histidine kinase and response regulator CckA
MREVLMNKIADPECNTAILSLEDSRQDYELIRELLSDAGYKLDIDLAMDESEYLRLLRSREYDIILADFKLPAYDAFEALREASTICPHTPFICFSGSIGEEAAIELIKKGAVDYVLKDRPERLPLAIERALKEAEEKMARRKAVTAQHNSEERLRTLINATPDLICFKDGQGKWQEANSTVLQVFQLQNSDYRGKLDSELAAISKGMGEELLDCSATDEIAWQSGTLFRQDRRFTDLEGGVKVFEMIKIPLYAEDGSRHAMVILGHDVTARKHAETALKTSEKRFRRLFEDLGDAVFVTRVGGSDSGRILEANPVAEQQTGYSLEELLTLNISRDLAVNGSSSITLQAWDKLLLDGERVTSVEKKRRKDGSEYWSEVVVTPIEYQGKSASLSISHDITERVRSDKIRTVQCNIARAMVTTDNLSNLYTVVRKELAEIVQVTNFVIALYDEKNGQFQTPFKHDEKDEIPSAWQAEKTLSGRIITLGSSQLLTKSEIEELIQCGDIERTGTVPEIWLGIPLRSSGRVIGIILLQDYENPSAYDSTSVQLLEAIAHGLGGFISHIRVEAERKRLSAAIEQAAETVVITDPEGLIVYANPAFERISGYSCEEAIGQNPRILKSGEQDAAFYTDLWDTISAGKVWQDRIVNKRKDDTLYTEEITISPVLSLTGEITNYVAVKRDITSEQEMAAQFQQAQKMESIGRLAGGVAHDFNNMLSVIMGYSELALTKLSPDDKLYSDIEEINKAGQRSADLTTQLLAFARKQTITPGELNLNDAVTNIHKMLRRLIGEDIELVLKPGAELGAVYVDLAQIDQILANLCVNARDAIKENGIVSIETDNITLDKAFCQAHRYATPGEYVVLSISDDGSGMDEETRKNIFEPFFTTKAEGEGTGLGLATVYGIVKQNGGLIHVYSEEGQGTTFKVYFPRYTSQGLSETSSTEEQQLSGHGELIMLVEDEPAILEMTKLMLQKSNYQVIAAGTPQEALNLAEEQSSKIELLITDVVMPGMNGKQLADRFRSNYPDLKILFMSGYTSDIIAQRGMLETGVNFINKPFSISMLAKKLRLIFEL